MPQESQSLRISEIATQAKRDGHPAIPEPEITLPVEPLVDAKLLETTEQRVAALLEVANKSIHDLEHHEHDEVAHLAEMIEGRARAWKRAAQRLQEQTDAMNKKADRVQTIADNLAAVVRNLAVLRETQR